jgi:hypothetical protein
MPELMRLASKLSPAHDRPRMTMFHFCAMASFKQNVVVKRVAEAEHGQPVKTPQNSPLNNNQQN